MLLKRKIYFETLFFDNWSRQINYKPRSNWWSTNKTKGEGVGECGGEGSRSHCINKRGRKRKVVISLIAPYLGL